MAISLLKKGEKVSLTKKVVGLKNIKVGLGWDENSSSNGTPFDLDASIFVLGSNQKVVSDAYFIFYNNLSSPDNAIIHQGDNRTGLGEGDDESVEIDLSKLSNKVEKIVFTVTIDAYEERNQNFGQINNAFIRIVDLNTNKEIAKYQLNEHYSTQTAMNFGELYKEDNQWHFKAVGEGLNDGLVGFCRAYGVNL